MPYYIRADLKWWIDSILNSNQSLKVFNFDIEIFSYSSKSGWGVYCSGTRIKGFWTAEQRKLHINFPELQAALYALKSFSKSTVNSNILLRVDYITAISCINKIGSTQFENLDEISSLT